ncbi:MAG TPA: S8 family serine peptidase [Steroidobacteraceae bacterium]|nr:S8 family serine peptidase [Steroidobacteraceae bacterium]
MPNLKLRVAAAAIMAGAIALGSYAPAQQAQSSRFQPFTRSGPITAQRQPLSLLAKERVKVVVIMSGESVAEVRARMPGHVIDSQTHDSIHSQIDRQHGALEPAIVSRGGKVLAHFHDAMNGMKVEIERGEIAGLSALPGVVQVVGVPKYNIRNAVSVPFIGAPAVWQGIPGFRGEHVKIAIIDTGVDYTHANFGGPGTAAAFAAAAATSTAPADPTMFGPNAPKVKGGTDLVGDAYNADVATSVPMPDPNPLDCNGHGSHVSGTAAGFGVTNDGATYHGPYNEAAYAAGFGIGPGVAPLADLYMVRVFGCTGSTNVVSEAIDWAVHNDMDVISMSLGSPYGTSTSADAIASDNAAKAGIIVVAAAGNNGPAPYITGDPASANHAISVAAMNARAFLVNGVHIALSSGGGANGVEANSLKLPTGSVPAVILKAGTGLSLGCNASDYPAGGAAGAIVIISRGTCSFNQKAANAEAAGAVAIGVVNNGAGFFNPLLTNVTIPFIELLLSDTPTFVAAPSPQTASVAPANLPDVTFKLAASFSSGGPRSGDGSLKPNVSAPGVNVFSTLIGSGNGGTYDSGTSMATPHVAGVAALAVQAHKDWKEPGLRAAVVQTAAPTALPDFAPRIEGAGLVQPVGATGTQVTVHGDEDGQMGLLSFGVAELTRDFREERDLIIRDHGRFPATFAATATSPGGVPHSVEFSSSTVSVRGHDETTLRMTLSIPAATAGATHDASGNVAFEDASGIITLTPEASANNGVALNLPYYAVTRARSDVDAQLREGKNPSIRLDNHRGAISGNGDFYAWGLKNPKSGTIAAAFEPRAVGVQTNPISATDSVLVFAVNTYGRFSNPATGEYDIYIDVNGDGVYDFILFSGDVGAVESGTANGQIGTFLVNLKTGTLLPEFPADAPTDGSIVLMPVFASDLGISPTNPRFSYTMNAFDSTGAGESLTGVASFNAFSPAISNAMFVPVAANTSVDVPVSIDPVEFLKTPALGFMVVTEDNVSGPGEANLLKLNH